MNRITSYEYHVSWSAEDEAFVARVTEFASLTAHGETREEAMREIEELMGFVVEDLEEQGERVPELNNVCMSKGMYRDLGDEAQRQSVSLNHLVVQKRAR